MQQSQLLENCRQVRVFTKILLFLGFLPFFFLLPCPLSPENIFKNQQLVQRIFSQHTVQTSGTKKVYFFFSVFLHQIKKKRKMSELLHNSSQFQNKDEKTHKEKSTPHPQNDVSQIQGAFCSLSKRACYGFSSSAGSLWYSATYRLLSMLLGMGLISVPSCSSILFRLKRSSYVIKLMAKPR